MSARPIGSGAPAGDLDAQIRALAARNPRNAGPAAPGGPIIPAPAPQVPAAARRIPGPVVRIAPPVPAQPQAPAAPAPAPAPAPQIPARAAPAPARDANAQLLALLAVVNNRSAPAPARQPAPPVPARAPASSQVGSLAAAFNSMGQRASELGQDILSIFRRSPAAPQRPVPAPVAQPVRQAPAPVPEGIVQRARQSLANQPAQPVQRAQDADAVLRALLANRAPGSSGNSPAVAGTPLLVRSDSIVGQRLQVFEQPVVQAPGGPAVGRIPAPAGRVPAIRVQDVVLRHVEPRDADRQDADPDAPVNNLGGILNRVQRNLANRIGPVAQGERDDDDSDWSDDDEPGAPPVPARGPAPVPAREPVAPPVPARGPAPVPAREPVAPPVPARGPAPVPAREPVAPPVPARGPAPAPARSNEDPLLNALRGGLNRYRQDMHVDDEEPVAPAPAAAPVAPPVIGRGLVARMVAARQAPAPGRRN